MGTGKSTKKSNFPFGIKKECSKCKTEKALTEFYKRDAAKDGLNSECKDCAAETVKRYRKTNAEKVAAYQRRWYESNKEKIKALNKRWAQANRDKKNAYYSKYRAQKLNATPPWLTSEHLAQMALFYAASNAQKQHGIDCEVDHIVPLQGEDVCGLHVPWNLAVIPKSENRSKKNKQA